MRKKPTFKLGISQNSYGIVGIPAEILNLFSFIEESTLNYGERVHPNTQIMNLHIDQSLQSLGNDPRVSSRLAENIIYGFEEMEITKFSTDSLENLFVNVIRGFEGEEAQILRDFILSIMMDVNSAISIYEEDPIDVYISNFRLYDALGMSTKSFVRMLNAKSNELGIDKVNFVLSTSTDYISQNDIDAIYFKDANFIRYKFTDEKRRSILISQKSELIRDWLTKLKRGSIIAGEDHPIELIFDGYFNQKHMLVASILNFIKMFNPDGYEEAYSICEQAFANDKDGFVLVKNKLDLI